MSFLSSVSFALSSLGGQGRSQAAAAAFSTPPALLEKIKYFIIIIKCPSAPLKASKHIYLALSFIRCFVTCGPVVQLFLPAN